MNDRINELELRYTEQQALVEELNQVVIDQQRALDSLTARVQHLEKKLEGEPGLVDSKVQERPPHY